MTTQFFELLQVAIGQRSELTSQPSAEEWAQLYEECERQSLIGIGFCFASTTGCGASLNFGNKQLTVNN